MIRAWLYRIAYPYYTCENCNDISGAYPCECSYHGAAAPGVPPRWYNTLARWLLADPEPRWVHVNDITKGDDHAIKNTGSTPEA